MALGVFFGVVTYLALREHLYHHYDRSAVVVAGIVIIHLVATGLVMPGVDAIKIAPASRSQSMSFRPRTCP